jgi:hypothetical protein
MAMKQFFSLCVCLFKISLPSAAAALTVEAIQSNGIQVFRDNRSGPNDIDVLNIRWTRNKPVTLRICLDQTDTAAHVAFSMDATNNTGKKWVGFHFQLGDNVAWAPENWRLNGWYDPQTDYMVPGYVAREPVYYHTTSRRSDRGFDPAIPPNALFLAVNASIDRHGLKPGDSFTIRMWPTPSRD